MENEHLPFKFFKPFLLVILEFLEDLLIVLLHDANLVFLVLILVNDVLNFGLFALHFIPEVSLLVVELVLQGQEMLVQRNSIS